MKNIAKHLEYTDLRDGAKRKEIRRLVDDSVKFGFGGICVSPSWTLYVDDRLNALGSKDTLVVTVPNWKLGGGLEQCPSMLDYICETCDEVDYIWNCYEFGDLKDWERTEKELATIREKTKGKLKVIIEAWYLRMMDEKIYKSGISKVLKEACSLVNKSGADYIKTDSGLFGRPDFDTLVEDCKLLLKHSKIPVKASGGIVDRYQAEKLLDLGVERIGTSKALDIITSDVNI